jgi:hypothetical protein
MTVGAQPAPSGRGTSMLIGVLALALILVGAAGAGYLLRDRPPATAGAPAQPATSTSLAPAEQPGPAAVELSADAKAHPDQDAVRILLQHYFDAINQQDYRVWTSTVVEERREAQPEQVWRDAYRTTRDGSIYVQRILPSGRTGLIVLLSFTSTQSPAQAPADLRAGCIHWQVAYPVTLEQGQARLDTGLPGSSSRAICPTS